MGSCSPTCRPRRSRERGAGEIVRAAARAQTFAPACLARAACVVLQGQSARIGAASLRYGTHRDRAGFRADAAVGVLLAAFERAAAGRDAERIAIDQCVPETFRGCA